MAELIAVDDGYCGGRGFVITIVMDKWYGDYNGFSYNQYLMFGADKLIELPYDDHRGVLTLQIERDLERLVLPDRFGNADVNGWTPFGLFHRRKIVPRGDHACLAYELIFPLTGGLERCSDGTQSQNAGVAIGLISFEKAKEASDRLLLTSYGLNVRNGDHFGMRQPKTFDLVQVDGEWRFLFKYEGATLGPPDTMYVIGVPLSGKPASVLTVPAR